MVEYKKLGHGRKKSCFSGTPSPKFALAPISFSRDEPTKQKKNSNIVVWSQNPIMHAAIYKFWMAKVVRTTCAEPRLPT